MKGYSPYENVADQRYPAILAETSLNDTRVLYVEPAKWVARLRRPSPATGGSDDILLKTKMSAGHGGVSGRHNAWRDRAFALAWLLDRLGRSGGPVVQHPEKSLRCRPDGNFGARRTSLQAKDPAPAARTAARVNDR